MLLRSRALLLIVALVGLFHSPTAFGQAPPKPPSHPTPPPPHAADHELFVPYWTTETGWLSELQLRNNAVGQNLTVTPALRLPNGTETSLAPVTIKPQEVKSIDLGAAIVDTGAPQLVGVYGSIVLRYRSPSLGSLYAALMVRSVGHPFAFHTDATGELQNHQAASREGIWWLPDKNTSDYLILTNKGTNLMQLDLSLFDAAGKEFQQQLLLGSHQTSRLSMRTLVQQGGLTGSYGGIRIHASANAGSLDSLHFLFDQQAGFSAVLKMFDHDPNAAIKERDTEQTGLWTLRAPMLALTQPDPALAFPAGTTLQPRLFIRNTTNKPLTATLRFHWRGDSITGNAQGPSLQLLPYETRRLDVASLQDDKILPKEVHWTSVTLTTNSQPDEIMAVAASYDAALQHGAQTPFTDQLSFKWEGGMWEYDAQHDSIITAGNGGSKPTRAAFTLFYNQGTQKYELEQTLQPDEQMWIDVGKLIREHAPDKNGKTLPADLSSGSYEFRDLTDFGLGALFEGKVIYDKTYGHAAYGCANCCGTIDTQLWFDPLGVPFGSTAGQGVNGYDNCALNWTDVSNYFYSHWNTTNTTVATADYYGTHTGASIGSTDSATSGLLREGSNGLYCPRQSFTPSGSANVVPGFTVGYNAYIDIDNITGPTGCTWGPGGLSAYYVYMGDANRGTYRTAEQIRVVPDLQTSSGFFPDTGQTRQYGVGSPANGSTLSDADEDNIPHDCYLWNDSGYASHDNFSYDASYPYAHQAQVHYTGSASNPLETQLASINWDTRTVLDTTSPQSPTAYVNYSHTCYPAHQIKVNGMIIYQYHPPAEDRQYIYQCLFLQVGTITGQTSAVTVPTQ